MGFISQSSQLKTSKDQKVPLYMDFTTIDSQHFLTVTSNHFLDSKQSKNSNEKLILSPKVLSSQRMNFRKLFANLIHIRIKLIG